MLTIAASLTRNPNNITGHIHAIDPFGSGSTYNQPVNIDIDTLVTEDIARAVAPHILTFAGLVVSPTPTPGYHGWRIVLDTESVVVVEFDFDSPSAD